MPSYYYSPRHVQHPRFAMAGLVQVVDAVCVPDVAEASGIQPRRGVVPLVAPDLLVLVQPGRLARPAVQPVQPAHAPAVVLVPAAWPRQLVDTRRRPLIGGVG